MAPALTETSPIPPYKLQQVSKDTFPDGIRTSGQHPPVYGKLKTFKEFPEEIAGPTAWKKEDYANNPEQWVHKFSPKEIVELSSAADSFIASGIPLTGISKVRSRFLRGG